MMPWDADRTWVTGEFPDAPITASQINRTGDRLRRAVNEGREPSDADRDRLDIFRSWHQPTLRHVQSRLTNLLHDQADLNPAHATVVGRPLKTREAITAKLVRSRTRLATMQDIAGARITVPGALSQPAIAELVQVWFGDAARVDRDSVEFGDDTGYRAIHVVVTLEGRNAEIQVRTRTQDAWAQIVESIDRSEGWDLKHGDGPAEWKDWLLELSEALRQVDLGDHDIPFPPSPYDREGNE